MARGTSSKNFSGSTVYGSPEIVHDEVYNPKRLEDDYEKATPHSPTKAVEKKAPEVSLFLVLLLLAAVTVVRIFSIVLNMFRPQCSWQSCRVSVSLRTGWSSP